MRQAVVRLHSKQSLAKLKADGSVVEGTGQIRNVSEYVVLQKFVWKKNEGPWMVWGTLEEKDWQSIIFDR